VLYRFKGSSNGYYPEAGLIDVNGMLYGATLGGGVAGGYGTVYTISTAGVEKVLHSFGGPSDGAKPRGRLTSLKGVLYGTTVAGNGTARGGTVFALSP
jgi:uncharacterized repeat protein (TIGR03803 family)